MLGRFGTLNVHRADCNRQHPNPCKPWEERLPILLITLRQMACSAYAWQECLPEQAMDLQLGLGWGTRKNPSYWYDEGLNVVAMDRKKFTDIEVNERSLWTQYTELGDKNRRSANWIKALHYESNEQVWFGSSHLETGNPEARVEQSRVLATYWPDITMPSDQRTPAILGIDRNSWTLGVGGPRWQLSTRGIQEAVIENPTKEASFNGFSARRDEIPSDGNLIDGIHFTQVKQRGASLVSTLGTGGTDHSGLVLQYTTIPPKIVL